MPDDTPTPTVNDTRRQMRQQALATREAMPTSLHAAAEARIGDLLLDMLAKLEPQVLGFCWPFRREADVRPAILAWLAGDANRRAALPVVVARGTALEFHRWQADSEMVAGEYDIPVPAHSERVQPDVLLIPLNAFDAAGYRIGYGGGYFDRTLGEVPARSVGIGFECGRVASTLPQQHDRPMDWIITEAGVFAGGGVDPAT